MAASARVEWQTESGIVIYVTPRPAIRQTRKSLWTKRSQAYAGYKRVLAEEMRTCGFVLRGVLSGVFVMPMPASWSDKKCSLRDGMPHVQRPDLDNLVKAVMDARGDDDSHVHTFRDVSKVWGRRGQIILRSMG